MPVTVQATRYWAKLCCVGDQQWHDLSRATASHCHHWSASRSLAAGDPISPRVGASTSCLNNMKQLGVAIANYESTRKHFPPGAIWDRWPPPDKRRRHGPILVQLLPYVEQQAIYDAFDFKKLSIDGAFFPGGTERIGSSVIDTYQCPSDDHNGLFENKLYGFVGVHNYSASNGPTEVYDNPLCSCVHPWRSFEMRRSTI